MRALVTGGAGFIGGALTQALCARGDDVVVLDSLDPLVHGAAATPLPQAVDFVRGDIRDAHVLQRVGEVAPDVVFHQAGRVGYGDGTEAPSFFDAVNVDPMEPLLRALARRRPPRVVLASSMAVYGEGAYTCPTCNQPRRGERRPEGLALGRWEPACPACRSDLEAKPVDESREHRPRNAYAASKSGQEAATFRAARRLGLEVVALRYHNVYGPFMPRDTPYAGVASLFKSRLLAGLPPLVHEDGAQRRDFVHVSDVVAANLLAAEAPASDVAGEAFNVASGDPRPIRDLAIGLARVLAPDLQPQPSGSYRIGDARHIFGSIAKARDRLQYRPTILLEDGMAEFARAPTREPPRSVAAR